VGGTLLAIRALGRPRFIGTGRGHAKWARWSGKDGAVAQLYVAHTADLDTDTLRAARVLLDDAFAGEFTGEDWEHALGGMHALLSEGAELIGHASLIQRRLLHGGRALRAGYVEGLAVRTGRRGLGYGAMLMAALERIVRGAYELGALSTTEPAAGFYAARGWLAWQGRSCALTPTGVIRTPDDDGGIYVLPCAVPLDLTGALICDWRDGDLW
jgi:aminoglycoside 2'-N-acetyltransferase I